MKNNGSDTLSVCLVDDDAIVRSLFSRVVERAGYEVITASGPEEAESILANATVDVLLSDLRMPEIEDGEQFLRATHRLYPEMAIVMMSSEWCEQQQARLAQHGANAFIVKPFNAKTLSMVIDGLCM